MLQTWIARADECWLRSIAGFVFVADQVYAWSSGKGLLEFRLLMYWRHRLSRVFREINDTLVAYFAGLPRSTGVAIFEALVRGASIPSLL